MAILTTRYYKTTNFEAISHLVPLDLLLVLSEILSAIRITYFLLIPICFATLLLSNSQNLLIIVNYLFSEISLLIKSSLLLNKF